MGWYKATRSVRLDIPQAKQIVGEVWQLHAFAPALPGPNGVEGDQEDEEAEGNGEQQGS